MTWTGARGKGPSDVTWLAMDSLWAFTRLADNSHRIQTHSSSPKTASDSTQRCTSAPGKQQPSSFFAWSSCLFQCVVSETAHSKGKSREMKELGRLGKGQAPLLQVSSMSEHAGREWGGPTGGQESWDPQMHATHWYPLRPCYAPGPGLASVGNLELNQILLLKSLQKGLEKWVHLLYVGQQKILELPPCSVVLDSSCTLESPVELLKSRDVCALLQSSCNPNLCESRPREETRCLLGPHEQKLH